MKKLKVDSKYLGNPLLSSRRKYDSYQYLINNIRNILASWKSQCLSCAGRVTLINLVLASIPNYMRTLSHLPKKITDKIDSISRKFFQGKSKEQSSYYAPIGWSKLCILKSLGGLAFRRAADLNRAILSKTAWSLIAKSNNMATKIILSKYRNFLEFHRTASSTTSAVWKGLQSYRDKLRTRMAIKIGNNLNTKIRYDPWILGNPNSLPITLNDGNVDQDINVAELILHEPRRWNEDFP